MQDSENANIFRTAHLLRSRYGLVSYLQEVGDASTCIAMLT